VKSLVISTARLDLIAATSESSRADVEEPEKFSKLLDVKITKDWPPAEFVDAQEIFARSLERSPELAGWLHWYWVLRDERVLIGSGGFGGKPDHNGKMEIGFSIVDSHHGRGYATEAVGALIRWTGSQKDVRRIVAATVDSNIASRRVLQKCGFYEVGPGEDPGTTEYEVIFDKKNSIWRKLLSAPGPGRDK
jgi:ribosomal-protein-alanine N-acetyltransferase